MTLRRISIAFFLILTPQFAQAQMGTPQKVTPAPIENPCLLTPDGTSCSQFVGCFGSEGLYFHGRADGRGTGPLKAKRSDGVKCTGRWKSRNALGTGQADFACENGENGRVLFYYQDEYSGTAKGKGVTNRFQSIQMWSGENLKKYFSEQDEQGRPVLKCGPVEALVS